MYTYTKIQIPQKKGVIFLETYKLLILNHEEIKHLNRLMMSEEIEAVIKIYQYRKV